jgi:S-formylglutathione hydrolase FrmB
MVMPDVNGAITADTECVDTARARPETYVTVDVRDYVISHFGASTNAGMWAVAGLSEGGTCAIDLALRHPNVFGGFEDLSGAIAPYVDSLKTARWELFGGSKSRQRHYDPQWLLRRHRCGFAWFDAGSQDRTDITTEQLLAKDARRAGLDTVFRIQPGGHTYWVFRPAFADAYPWIVGHLTPHVYCASRANV